MRDGSPKVFPLVHVTGVRESRPPEMCVAFTSLLLNTPYAIPTSAHLMYCSNDTRRVEELLGFSGSVYFFAGRACPSFGDVALAFAPECQGAHTGSATPFDTGGLILRHLHGNLPADDPGRVAFGREATLPLAEWRGWFAQFLAAYFPNVASYWTGSALCP